MDTMREYEVHFGIKSPHKVHVLCSFLSNFVCEGGGGGGDGGGGTEENESTLLSHFYSGL